jgi:hypothetical protein
MTMVQGCSSDEKSAAATGPQMQGIQRAIQSTPGATEKMAPELLAVKSFSLTKENLRLDYLVTNVLPHDIWVCANINHYAKQDSEFTVESLVCDGTLQIRRRANLEQNCFVTAALIYAVYYRLSPGESRSDMVLLPLPIRSSSPVVMTGIPQHPVVLNRVVEENDKNKQARPTKRMWVSLHSPIECPSVCDDRMGVKLQPRKWANLPILPLGEDKEELLIWINLLVCVTFEQVTRLASPVLGEDALVCYCVPDDRPDIRVIRRHKKCLMILGDEHIDGIAANNLVTISNVKSVVTPRLRQAACAQKEQRGY